MSINVDKLENTVTEDRQDNVINIIVSKADQIQGIIRNGDDGVIKETRIRTIKGDDGKKLDKVDVIEILRFKGKIGPVFKIDGIEIGIHYDLNGEQGTATMRELRSTFRRIFSLTPSKMQQLIEVLTAYVFMELQENHVETYYRNKIHLIGNVISCDYDGGSNTKDILRALLDFYPHSTHPDAFLSSISRNLVSPLHYELKCRMGILTKIPFGLLQGTTGAGKTPTSEIVMGKGYDQPRNEWFFQYENVKTFFSLMKHLTTSNLPCLYSDVNGSWIFQNKESFKSYSQSGNIASRGTSDQMLNEYIGYRTFDIDTNSTVRPDDDSALSGRFSSYIFTADNKRKVNRQKFIEFSKKIPTGFMYALFKECFVGKSIEDIVADVEGFDRATQWEDYGINNLNKLCDVYGFEHFHFFRKANNEFESNTENIAYAFMDQWFKDHEETTEYEPATQQEIKKRKNIPMFSENQLRVTERDDPLSNEKWIEILFQASAYETLIQRLGLQVPYKKAAEFIANVIETDKIKLLCDGKPTSQRMKDGPRKVYGLKVIL